MVRRQFKDDEVEDAKAELREEAQATLLANIRALRKEFYNEALRRKGLGGYSTDSGTILSLCEGMDNVLGILDWLIEEKLK